MLSSRLSCRLRVLYLNLRLILKLLFIFLNIGLNLLYFVWLGKTSVFYVFFINLLCTAFITLFFIPDLFRVEDYRELIALGELALCLQKLEAPRPHRKH